MENDSHSRALLGAHGMNKELHRRMLTDPPTNRTPGSAEECSQTRSPLTGLHEAQMSTGQAVLPRMSSLSVPNAEVSSTAYHSNTPAPRSPSVFLALHTLS